MPSLELQHNLHTRVVCFFLPHPSCWSWWIIETRDGKDQWNHLVHRQIREWITGIWGRLTSHLKREKKKHCNQSWLEQPSRLSFASSITLRSRLLKVIRNSYQGARKTRHRSVKRVELKFCLSNEVGLWVIQWCFNEVLRNLRLGFRKTLQI